MKDGVQLTNNHDLFRIELNNIDKSRLNSRVSLLMAKHYDYLHSKLVKIPLHEDIFLDAYLKLTYNYDPDSEFIDLFMYYFNMLKGWYYRSGKVIKYHITELDENTEIEDEEYKEVDNDTNFEDLRNAVLSKSK